MAASVTVKVDLRNSLPDRIWIGMGSDGFWQRIKYVNLLLLLPKDRSLYDRLKKIEYEKEENLGSNLAPLPSGTGTNPIN